jgi:hypothetical protein
MSTLPVVRLQVPAAPVAALQFAAVMVAWMAVTSLSLPVLVLQERVAALLYQPGLVPLLVAMSR